MTATLKTTRSLVLVLIATLAFGLFASAQAQSPLEISANVMVRLGGDAANCADAGVVLNEDLSGFYPAYCGTIPDTLTDINKRWTVDKLRDHGYTMSGDWQFSLARNTFPMYIAGFYKPGAPNLVVALAVLGDFSVIVMAYGN